MRVSLSRVILIGAEAKPSHNSRKIASTDTRSSAACWSIKTRERLLSLFVVKRQAMNFLST